MGPLGCKTVLKQVLGHAGCFYGAIAWDLFFYLWDLFLGNSGTKQSINIGIPFIWMDTVHYLVWITKLSILSLLFTYRERYKSESKKREKSYHLSEIEILNKGVISTIILVTYFYFASCLVLFYISYNLLQSCTLAGNLLLCVTVKEFHGFPLSH